MMQTDTLELCSEIAPVVNTESRDMATEANLASKNTKVFVDQHCSPVAESKLKPRMMAPAEEVPPTSRTPAST